MVEREREWGSPIIHCNNCEEYEEDQRECISYSRISVWLLSAAAEVENHDQQAKTKQDEPDSRNKEKRNSCISHGLHIYNKLEHEI